MLDQSSFYFGEVLNSPFEIRIAYIDLISERNDQKRKYLLDHYNFNFQTFLTVFLCRIFFFIFIFYIPFSNILYRVFTANAPTFTLEYYTVLTFVYFYLFKRFYK